LWVAENDVGKKDDGKKGQAINDATFLFELNEIFRIKQAKSFSNGFVREAFQYE